MKRRYFIESLSLGGTSLFVWSGLSLVQSCEVQPTKKLELSSTDILLLDEIAETILPETKSSPGARAAEVGKYMLLMYKDCMNVEQQLLFEKVVLRIEQQAIEQLNKSFIAATKIQKTHLLNQFQVAATAYENDRNTQGSPLVHDFSELKNLVISGYFSSEIGMTQARNYVPIPGSFQGCVPYKLTDKPWAI